MLVVIRVCSAVSPFCYFLYFVFSFSCWRTSCWCWSMRFVCLVDFYNYNIVDAPSAEAVGRTGAVTGSVGATHVQLLLTLLQSASASTITRRPSASKFVWMLMAHFWSYFWNLMMCSCVGYVPNLFMRISSSWMGKQGIATLKSLADDMVMQVCLILRRSFKSAPYWNIITEKFNGQYDQISTLLYLCAMYWIY